MGKTLEQRLAIAALGGGQLPESFREAGRGLLPAAGDLIASDLPAPDHVVEQPLRALPRSGRGPGGRRQRALNRRSQCLADPLRGRCGVLPRHVWGELAHAAQLSRLGPRRGYGPAPPPLPVHLRPLAPTAPDALLCGDPGRALAIAQRVLVRPRMSNHHRGLWGYYGETPAGLELSIQATGIGGPSAAVVVGELADLGLRRAVRIGTCSARGPLHALGAGVVVGAAFALDGTSAALGFGSGQLIEADPPLSRELAARRGSPFVTVRSRDVFPSEDQGAEAEGSGVQPEHLGDGVVEDLQTAGMLASCRLRGVAAGALLAVARCGCRRLEDEPLERAHLDLAETAVEALLR